MLTESEKKGLNVTEATRLRQQALELLERLIADREQSEKRFADAGKRDPMKFITGRTALENAISSTREMIGNMDNLLAKMQTEIDALTAPPPARNRALGRTASKNGLRPAVAMTSNRPSFKSVAMPGAAVP